jgi:hypothetical protein
MPPPVQYSVWSCFPGRDRRPYRTASATSHDRGTTAASAGLRGDELLDCRGRRWLCRTRGRARFEHDHPFWHHKWWLAANADRQCHRLRGVYAVASGRRLFHRGDQRQFLPPDHARNRARAGRITRREPRKANHHLRGLGKRARRSNTRPWNFHYFGASSP